MGSALLYHEPFGDNSLKSQPSLTDISVIIAARNEEKTLNACLDSILVATKGEAEVIVVDDASTDRSLDILKTYSGKMRLIHGEGRGPGRARNLAIHQTDRPWVAFTDGDCRVDPQWLIQLRSSVLENDATFSSVGGIQRISRDAGLIERKIGEFFESVGFVSDYIHGGEDTRRVRHNPTCNVLYSRKVLVEAEGFDESLWPCEDLDLDLRLQKKGFGAWLNPKARVEHRRPDRINGFLHMMKRYGYAHVQLTKKHGIAQPLHVLPVLFPFVLLLLLGGLALSVWIPVGLILLIVVLIFTGFLIRTLSASRAILFSAMWVAGTGCWLIGFYSGMMGSRRVAKQNG